MTVTSVPSIATSTPVGTFIIVNGKVYWVFVANDAEEALEYLEKAKRDSENHPLPDLILLDLNMPGIGGKEFLRRIKEDDDKATAVTNLITEGNNASLTDMS